MPKCINLSIPQVVDDLNELTRILRNEDAAYAVLAKNNENSLEYNLQGNPSELFNQLLVATKGNRQEAIRLKSVIYTSDFMNKTEWMDKGEPTIGEVMAFVESLGNKSVSSNTSKYAGIGSEDLDNLIDDNLNVNWRLLDMLQMAFFSKETAFNLKNRPEKHSGEKYTWDHIKNVVESAKKIPIPSNVNRKTLILAALLHDIGKPYRNEDHALDSVKVINKLFKDNQYSKLLKLAVRHHMISASTTQNEYSQIIKDAKENGVKVEDFVELLIALNIADITRNRPEDVIDDYSGKSLKDTLSSEIPLKRKNLFQAINQKEQPNINSKAVVMVAFDEVKSSNLYDSTNKNLQSGSVVEYAPTSVARKEADSRPPNTRIPQNVNGKGKDFILKTATGKGESSIDMIDAGIRTRTTRSKDEFNKYNIKPGSYTYMFGTDSNGNVKNVLVKITAVYDKTDPRWKDNWKKEGWAEEEFSKIKNLDYAIEFEKVSESNKQTWLVRGVNSSGKVQLIDKDGSNFSGTPDVKSVNVIGSYPTVEFNKVQYIVADNNEIYSSATGKKVFEGQDETSQKAKKLILDKAFEEHKRSKLSPVLNAIKNGTRVFTMATKNRLNSMEMFVREELLAKGFEYVEKDDVGFYSVPGPKQVKPVHMLEGLATISSTIFELNPGISDVEIQKIYDNYVGLMSRAREGKELPLDTFKTLLKSYQVFNYKDTYIFGQWDSKNAVFITRLNSSPTSRELLAEALPTLVSKGLDFISFVPKDVADKYKRSGYTVSSTGFDYDFKGEEMTKYAAVSNPGIFNKLFGSNENTVTSKQIEDYNESLALKYTPVEVKADLVAQAGNDLSKILEIYLNQFGIVVKDIAEIKDKLGIDELGFADILSKVAYVKDKKNLPPIAGEFIAYMMQYNPLVSEIIKELSQTTNYKKLNKTEYFKVIGELIGKDLQNKLEGNYSKSLVDKIKELIDKFLKLIQNTPVDLINKNIGIISDNILQQNKKLITASLYKPGAFGKPTKQVSLQAALDSDPFGNIIIGKLSKEGFILTGSTSLGEQGTIQRPDENLLHDIDWVSPFNREETKEKFLKHYPKAIYVRNIYGGDYTTDSWLIAPEGYHVTEYVSETYGDKVVIQSYNVRNAKNEIVGTYNLEEVAPKTEGEKSERKEITSGVAAKVIDFFSYTEYNQAPATELQGIKLSNWKDIFKAKLMYARYKDIWDYNRFIPKENLPHMYKEEVSSENTNNNFKLNRVEIDLRKLGITFELTADQKQFLQTFADWLDDSNPTMRGKNFLLNGYAGTGKTTVMNVALEYAKNTRKKMVLTATTAKAADVQRKMYGATAVTSTLHSALGIAPTRDNTLKEIKSSLKPGDILVIDESSMIDDKLYAEIKQRGYKTIFIGDDAQFKPVKKGALSKVFDTSDKVVSKLTSLVRQGEGNVLIETLTKLRTNQETAQNPLGDKMDSKIDQATQTGLEWNYGAEFNDRIKEMFTSDEYKKNPDFVKLLVAANWEVEKYNKEIRRHLGFKQEIEVGEVMVGYENVQYGKDEDQFKNGSDYKVTEVSYNANVTVPNPLNSADPFHLPLISVSMENVLTGEVIMDHILSRNVPAAEMQKLVEVYKELDQQYKSARGELKRNIEKKLDFLDSQFMNMENIVSPDYKDRWGKEVILKSKVIDYGYAITVHKSQGSGYQYVLVDEAGISTIQSKYGDILGGNQSRYVSFSRAFKGVIARTHKPLGTKDRFDFSKKTSGSDKIIATFESVALDAMNEDGLVGKNCKL